MDFACCRFHAYTGVPGDISSNRCLSRHPEGITPQSKQCSASPSDGLIGSARFVHEGAATAADIATVGFVAGGVTAPIAVATKLVGYGVEAGLLGVNLY